MTLNEVIPILKKMKADESIVAIMFGDSESKRRSKSLGFALEYLEKENKKEQQIEIAKKNLQEEKTPNFGEVWYFNGPRFIIDYDIEEGIGSALTFEFKKSHLILLK